MARNRPTGKVYLVGAGPGDPDLITVKGRRVLRRAQCVLYDHLASRALLDFAPAEAERLYVGKKKDLHTYKQGEITELLIGRARRGLRVVRLKGGDPFIFGRGGEEAEALAEAGIPFEVVPGIPTPLGIAAYSGVPLTHREHTSVVTFVTGHDVARIDWAKVGAAETLVIFMGLTTFPEIAAAIMAHGRSPETPAMAVRWATRPDQQTIVATLGTLPRLLQEQGMKPPATIVVGEVVRLRDKLNWFESLPLHGKKIVVTRALGQAADVFGRLQELGAQLIEFPVIATRPALDYGPLDAAIARLDAYDWLIFTSANGVRFFLERLDRSSADWRSLRARICAIGPGTRRAVEELHLKVDLVPEEYVAESLVQAFKKESLTGKRILLPRAAVARDLVPKELTRLGAQVDVVEAYRTVIPESARRRASEIFGAGKQADWVTFTSSSTVVNFVKTAGLWALAGTRVASIGPVTSETAQKLGIHVDVEAEEHTMEGLVEAIVGFGG
jgi:uroporphyrinogen III methyltransferase/synthase